MILYHCNTSYASYKARLYLVEKGIEWEGHHLDLRKQEHLKGDFRKINPNGTVPALVDGDQIICGSTKLQEYLEEKYPTPPMLPKDLTLRKEIHGLLCSHDALHDPHIRTMSYHRLFMNPKKREDMNVEELLKLADNHPNKARGEFLRRAALGKLTKEEVDKAEKAIKGAIEDIEQRLSESGGPFLFGKAISMADTVALSTLLRSLELGFAIDTYPQINQWISLMKSRPSYFQAIEGFQ